MSIMMTIMMMSNFDDDYDDSDDNVIFSSPTEQRNKGMLWPRRTRKSESWLQPSKRLFGQLFRPASSGPSMLADLVYVASLSYQCLSRLYHFVSYHHHTNGRIPVPRRKKNNMKIYFCDKKHF